MTNQNEQEIQQWMESIAKSQPPKKTLVFDKKLKKLVAVSPGDARLNPHSPDAAVPFGPEEAKRFMQ